MRNLLLAILLIFLFSCEKEPIEISNESLPFNLDSLNIQTAVITGYLGTNMNHYQINFKIKLDTIKISNCGSGKAIHSFNVDEEGFLYINSFLHIEDHKLFYSNGCSYSCGMEWWPNDGFYFISSIDSLKFNTIENENGFPLLNTLKKGVFVDTLSDWKNGAYFYSMDKSLELKKFQDENSVGYIGIKVKNGSAIHLGWMKVEFGDKIQGTDFKNPIITEMAIQK